MTLAPVSDPQGDSVSKLTSVFQDKPRIASLLRAFSKPSKILQDIAFQMLTERTVQSAQGAQLDGIGGIVGESRNGRDDPTYRIAIILRIAINTSKGTPENAINVFTLATGSTLVQLLEYFPGHVSITGDVNFQFGYSFLGPDSFAFAGGADGLGFGDVFDSSVGGVFVGLVIFDTTFIFNAIQAVLPAGVELDYLGYYVGNAFAFDGGPDGLGFGDFNDANVGGGFAGIVPHS